MSTTYLLSRLSLWLSQAQALFACQEALYTARFALPHELIPLLSPTLNHPTSLLLGESRFHQVLRVVPTPTRPELGNLLITSRTRGGKGLLATSQLLTWKHSVVVNDIKGELFARTAGYRQTLGQVFVIDPTGVGHAFDPLEGRQTEDKLYSSAKYLLFDPPEKDGVVFTQRAARMLTYLFLGT